MPNNYIAPQIIDALELLRALVIKTDTCPDCWKAKEAFYLLDEYLNEHGSVTIANSQYGVERETVGDDVQRSIDEASQEESYQISNFERTLESLPAENSGTES